MGIFNYRSTGEIDTGQPADTEIELSGARWVPALRPQAPLAYPLGESPNTLTDSHLAALDTIRETATPFWRAVALVIRSLAPALLITGLVLIAALIAGADEEIAAGIIICGAVLVAVFWYYTDKAERRDSAAGIERHKADLAHDLEAMRIGNQHELSRTALDRYFRHLEGK